MAYSPVPISSSDGSAISTDAYLSTMLNEIRTYLASLSALRDSNQALRVMALQPTAGNLNVTIGSGTVTTVTTVTTCATLTSVTNALPRTTYDLTAQLNQTYNSAFSTNITRP